ncbi:MAG: N-acetylmuramoyl-L-alanine amidase [Acidobacteria bacterium]|nr:N-acetylmuramoyl-L-alanine amidase [Acidobacteriota bacterium]
MRSTSGLSSARWLPAGLAVAAFVVAALLPAPSWQEKRLSIYLPGRTLTLPVLDRNGHEYADLGQILAGVGPLRVKREGRSWKASLGKRDAELEEGKTSSRIAGTRFELPHPALIDEGRGLVPLASLPRILGRMLDARVDAHESARRIFVGGAATRFTAEVLRTDAPALVLNFTSAVSPSISTERNTLRMVFQRDAVVSGSQNFRFESGPVSSATFSESDGIAALTLLGETPLLATSRDDGRTLVITAAPSAPQAAAAPPPATLPAEVPPDASALGPTPEAAASQPASGGLPPPVGRPRYLVVVDASHGGPERGAALSNEIAEKDVTLALARRLRNELQIRGVQSVMVRESDAAVELDERAALTNTSHAAVYVTLHAAVLGHGVRVYTSLLAPAQPDAAAFLPWESAQAPHVEASRALSSAVAAELNKRRITAASLAAPVRPLNNVTAAAIAVEVTPPSSNVRSINSPGYQQQVAAAVAAAVWQVRLHLEPMP